MWSFRIDDLAGNPLGALRDATGRRLTFSLTDPPTLDFTTELDAAGLAEFAVDIVAHRDGVAMFRGRLAPSSDTITAGTHSTTWQALGYEAALARTPVWPGATTTWSSVDQAQIVEDLVTDAAALPGVDWQITAAGLTPTGRVRDYSVELGKPVGDALSDLAAMIDGFDWSISPAGQLEVWYPQRGTVTSWAAVLGATITRADRSFDPGTYATDVLGLGADTLPAVTRSAPSRPLGRWTTSASWADVSVASTLAAKTEGLLALSGMQAAWQVQVAAGRWSPAEAWLGDTIDLHVDSGRLHVHEPQRIVGVTVDVDDTDVETVTLTLGRAPATLAALLKGIEGRIGNVERLR